MRRSKVSWISRPMIPQLKPFKLWATVEGKKSIPVSERPAWPDELHNGDFTVRANGSKVPVTGDGQDEWTWWAFDFRNRAEWHQILTIMKLNSAVLQLSMATGADIGGSSLRWVSVEPWIGGNRLNEPFKQLRPHQEVCVRIDLLQYWTPEEIVHALMSYPAGSFQMEFADDALLFGGELTIQGKAYVKP